MAEYCSVIKNELGEIVRFCKEWTNKENEEFLKQHPEYYKDVEKRLEYSDYEYSE